MSGQRRALIIANDQYLQEGLRDLLAPPADAEALGRVLGDPRIGEFNVQVRFGHGRLDQPRDRLDASDWALVLLGSGGISDLSLDEIAQSLRGHSVNASAGATDEAFTLGTDFRTVSVAARFAASVHQRATRQTG